MKTCFKCNLSFSDDKKFCKSCGNLLDIESILNPKDFAQKSVFEEKLKINPLDTALLCEYAQFLCNTLLFKDAIAVLLKILAIDKNDLFAQDLLYKSYKKNGNMDDAFEIGQALLLSNPQNVYLLSDLTDMAILANKNNDALAYLNRIITIKPNDKAAWIKKAELHHKLSNIEDVIESWAKVFEIDNTNIIARMYMGINASIEKNYKKSCELLEPVINNLEKQDDNKMSLFHYVYSLVKVNEYDDRISELIKSLNLFSLETNPIIISNNLHKIMLEELFVFQGNYELGKGNNDNAVKYFISAFELFQNENCKQFLADAYFQKSKTHFDVNEMNHANEKIAKALKLYPKNIEFLTFRNKIASFEANKKKKTFRIFLIVGIVLATLASAYIVGSHLVHENVWKNTVTENTPTAYQMYLDKYPKGKYVTIALKRIGYNNGIITIEGVSTPESTKLPADIKTLTLMSPTYISGDLPHLFFINFITQEEQAYECDWDLPVIREIMSICEDQEGCPALKGQVFSATLKLKLMDEVEYNGETGALEPTGKKEKRWVMIALQKIDKP